MSELYCVHCEEGFRWELEATPKCPFCDCQGARGHMPLDDHNARINTLERL